MKTITLKVIFVIVNVIWALVMMANIVCLFAGNIVNLLALLLSTVWMWSIVIDAQELYYDILCDIMEFVYDNFGLILWGSIALFGILAVPYSPNFWVNELCAIVSGWMIGDELVAKFKNRA